MIYWKKTKFFTVITNTFCPDSFLKLNILKINQNELIFWLIWTIKAEENNNLSWNILNMLKLKFYLLFKIAEGEKILRDFQNNIQEKVAAKS